MIVVHLLISTVYCRAPAVIICVGVRFNSVMSPYVICVVQVVQVVRLHRLLWKPQALFLVSNSRA